MRPWAKIAVLSAFLLTQPVLAQWQGWPITNNWYQVTNNPLAQLYTAAVERATISGIAPPSGSVTTNAIYYKTNFFPILNTIESIYHAGNWVDPYYLDTNGTFDSWLSTNAAFPILTLTNLSMRLYGTVYPWTIWPSTADYLLAEVVDAGSLTKRYYKALPANLGTVSEDKYSTYVGGLPFEIRYSGTWQAVTCSVAASVDSGSPLINDWSTNLVIVLTGQTTVASVSNIYAITFVSVTPADLGTNGEFLSFVIPTTGVCRCMPFTDPRGNVDTVLDSIYDYRLRPQLLEEARTYLTNLVWRKQAGTVVADSTQYVGVGTGYNISNATYIASTNYPVPTSAVSNCTWYADVYYYPSGRAEIYGGKKAVLTQTYTNAYSPAVHIYCRLTNNVFDGGTYDQFSTFGWWPTNLLDKKYHMYTSVAWTAHGTYTSNRVVNTDAAPLEWHTAWPTGTYFGRYSRSFLIDPVAVLHYTNLLFQ